MTSFQFVTAVHGNEYLPTLALASAGINQIIGNPRALARGVRYTEKDLNASFGTSGHSYEEERAREIKRLIPSDRIVVDFHTFSCHSEPFAIVVDLALLPLARRLGVKHVAYMKHNIKAGHALINHCAGISVEVGHHTDSKGFTLTQKIVHNLTHKKVFDVCVYEVFGRIEERGDYVNFQNTGEFIPILFGERAYDGQGFYGLKAREITGTISEEGI